MVANARVNCFLVLAVGDGRFGSWAGWDIGSRLPLLLACAWSWWQHWEPREKSMQQEIFEMPRQDIDSNHSLERTPVSASVSNQSICPGVAQLFRWRALGMRRVVLL